MRGGVKWQRELVRRLENPIYLEGHGYRVYSQNCEDGILCEIFRRIGVSDKRFIEFGVQNGLQCNSHYLLHKNWFGLWIEGSPRFFEEIQALFKSVILNGRLKAVNCFITKNNINQIFKDASFTGEIDLLSIDIDGNDYHVWEAVDAVNPRVVVIEYNARFPADCEYVMPYKRDHVWDGSDRFGASLKSLELLGLKKGYALVGTDLNGINAFFVRRDLTADLFPSPASSENLYNFTFAHSAKYCLADDGARVNESIESHRIKAIAGNLQKRGLVVWGTGYAGGRIGKLLEELAIDVCAYTYTAFEGGSGGAYNGKPVIPVSSLQKGEHYVIVAALEREAEITPYLARRGFAEPGDYTTARYILNA